MSFTTWADDRVKKAVDHVMDRLETKFDAELEEIKAEVFNIDNKIVDLSTRMLGQVDSLDGKMGNLQEQLVAIPGQMVTSVTQAVEQAIRNFNPFR